MTIAVSQATAQAYASATSVTTGALTTVTDSLIVIAAGAYDGGGLAGVTRTPSDSKSNSWTAIDLIGDATTLGGFYYNLAGTRGASHTFTFGLDTAAQMSAVGIEITGQALASVLDQSASDSNTSGTATVTSAATAIARCLVLGMAITRGTTGTVNWNANGTITGSNGTDIILDNDGATHGAGFAVWYRIVSAVGAQTASRSHDAVSSDWTCLVAAFKEAGGLLVPRMNGGLQRLNGNMAG